MDVAVIGCIVNGPGEAREADVGLTGATPSNLIYVDGEPDHKVSNADFVDHLESVIRERRASLEAERAEADRGPDRPFRVLRAPRRVRTHARQPAPSP
jgi:(E)-4-hydroxy-3-methylbut-2-enyl-diphosphate synthase